MHPLLAGVCIVVILAGIKAAASLLAPLLLAAAIAIAFQPIGDWLKRRRLSPVGAMGITMSAVIAALGAIGAVVWLAGAQLVSALPRYEARLVAARDEVAGWLAAQGLTAPAQSLAGADMTGWAGSLATRALGQVPAMAGALIVILITTAFIQLESGSYRRKLSRLVADGDTGGTRTSALRAVQTYLKIRLILNGVGAILLGLLCWACGLDSPAMWAVVAFGLSFVPIVGGYIAGAAPVVLAFATGGVGLGLVVAAGYAGVDLVLGVIVRPCVFARRMPATSTPSTRSTTTTC